jgi:hypothetical protein
MVIKFEIVNNCFFGKNAAAELLKKRKPPCGGGFLLKVAAY